MAIRLKYGAPGPVLLAGYAGGVGKAQQRDEENGLAIWQRQQQQGFQAQQANIDRGFRAWQQEQGFQNQAALQEWQQDFLTRQRKDERAFQAGEGVLQRDFQRGMRKEELDFRAKDSALDREQRAVLVKQQQDRLQDNYIMDGIRKGELALPPDAQRKLDQLEAGRVEAMKLDPAQQQEFMDRYESEKRMLTRMAQPVPKMSLQDDFKQNVMEKDGVMYQRGERGWDVLREPKEDPQKEYDQKYNESVMKRFEKNLSETDPEDPEKSLYADEDSALQAAIDEQNAIERARQRLQGGRSGSGSGSGSGTGSGYSAQSGSGGEVTQQFNPVAIKASDGNTYKFTSQQQLDEFKRLTGM